MSLFHFKKKDSGQDRAGLSLNVSVVTAEHVPALYDGAKIFCTVQLGTNRQETNQVDCSSFVTFNEDMDFHLQSTLDLVSTHSKKGRKAVGAIQNLEFVLWSTLQDTRTCLGEASVQLSNWFEQDLQAQKVLELQAQHTSSQINLTIGVSLKGLSQEEMQEGYKQLVQASTERTIKSVSAMESIGTRRIKRVGRVVRRALSESRVESAITKGETGSKSGPTKHDSSKSGESTNKLDQPIFKTAGPSNTDGSPSFRKGVVLQTSLAGSKASNTSEMEILKSPIQSTGEQGGEKPAYDASNTTSDHAVGPVQSQGDLSAVSNSQSSQGVLTQVPYTHGTFTQNHRSHSELELLAESPESEEPELHQSTSNFQQYIEKELTDSSSDSEREDTQRSKNSKGSLRSRLARKTGLTKLFGHKPEPREQVASTDTSLQATQNTQLSHPSSDDQDPNAIPATNKHQTSNTGGHSIHSAGLTAPESALRPPSSTNLLASADDSDARPPGPPRSRSALSIQSVSTKDRKKKKNKDFEFETDGQDIFGIVMLEVIGAKNLPKIKNATRLGWDMDPFVIISFGRKTFRTRVIRHSLNPTWDEKLYFPVKSTEMGFKLCFALADWDKMSGNDAIADVEVAISEVLNGSAKPDPETGLYPDQEQHDTWSDCNVPLRMLTASTHEPATLHYRVKFTPYAALRQTFWRQYLKNFDTDDTGSISKLEISIMLDSLGSTLSSSTIDSFYRQHGKDPATEELTINECIVALEAELQRPLVEKKLAVDSQVSSPLASPSLKPVEMPDLDMLDISLANTSISGPTAAPAPTDGTAQEMQEQEKSVQKSLPSSVNPRNQSLVAESPQLQSGARKTSPIHQRLVSSASIASSVDSSDVDGSNDDRELSQFEQMISIKTCPLCHKQRLKRKAEKDMITHIALCASSDWSRLDRMAVSSYVTPAQAHRKWYTRVVAKVASGAYGVGANSANILVQDRETGQILEEKMQIYVRLGIRMLYKGAKGRMESDRARKMLKSMSIKQGVKYDSPASARAIPAFIAFHQLNLDEMLEPIQSYKTFNEFFYRKLKPEARPLASPDDHSILVSPADCRMMVFPTVKAATEIWIKGLSFTIEKLLGPKLAHLAPRYEHGSLLIARLAPQDYHRYHSPVDGVLGEFEHIDGEYYTVNPQAVRSPIDIYATNVRQIIPFNSPAFGTVMSVQIGAMMVGSILTTVKPGDTIKRGDNFGYFAFGGSTIVLLFEPGRVTFDQDLLDNGKVPLETLVRMGSAIGKAMS